jgi:hypothetical protein
MTAIALCRSLSEIFVGSKIVSMVQGLGNRRRQDKARKVRAVGRLEDGSNFNHASNVTQYRPHLAMFRNALSLLIF